MKMTKLEKKIYRILWKHFNSGYLLKYDDELLLGLVQYIIETIKNDLGLDQ